ncbi:MAG: glycoside hydrolase family 32 protein [Lewinella sp.]|nr:glycoside hydrolase family 32 protein [Lewinella sp.]
MRYSITLLCSFALLFTACDGGSPGTSDDPAFAANSETATAPAAAPDDYLRPGYHFTPPAGWMNDPNGMVYHAGEWHLFYQYYPDGNKWGPMHWGHAVSTDLVSWEHLPIALYPDELGYIFSGSAVIDKENTAGFGKNAMVAIYTYHDMVGEKAGREDFQSQAIAYSTDKGRTWTKYAGNPVIPNRGVRDFRDPKVIWDAEHAQWLMVLAAQDRVQFFGSKNLKEWNYLSEWGQKTRNHSGVWECPELFPLTVVESQDSAWVLNVSINPGGANGGSGTFYFPGYWDGKEFTPRWQPSASATDTVSWVDYGRDNYAGVTFSDVPDGRRVFMGWMSNWNYAQEVPTESWRSAMTIPRDLSLHATDFGVRLHQQPVEELEELRGKEKTIDLKRLPDGVTVIDLKPLSNNGQIELDLTVDLMDSDAEELYLTFSDESGEHYYRTGYSRKPGVENALFSDRRFVGNTDFKSSFAPERLTVAPRWSNHDELRIRAFLDRTSAEVFFDEGDPVLTDIFFPKAPFTKLMIEAHGSVGEGMPSGWRLVYGKLWGIGPSQ